ncbi:hypothetical protein LCGC14_1829220 [marine sediment metagenome]|uniref:Uncharacterized protein n=1 Tax=marine sediment metagenome TaxID=412755 RepID=A0A0F9H4S2_9ZZZZ
MKWLRDIRETFRTIGSQIIGLDNRIVYLENKTKSISNYCIECGVYFKAGTGKNIGWTNIYHFSYGPVSGTYHYCSWCQPDYDRTEFIIAMGEKDPSWKYFKCEEVDLETKEHES